MGVVEFLFGNTIIKNVLIAVISGILACRINDYVFKKIDNGKNRIHLQFFRRLFNGFIIITAIIFAFTGFKGFDKLYGVAFGSSVVITAVLGIIGKDIFQDVLAGIMISIYRPFNIGDRVLMSDIDKPCVVDDMTGRHVVLKTMDNVCYIIPNSEINDRIILNTSYNHGDLRGTFLKFQISYSSDIRLAIHLIREAVKNCPHTLPNNSRNHDLDGYGDVYLMGFSGSAYELETTIWTKNDTDNFLACSEVRIAVVEKFKQNNIEIPYNYLNVVYRDEKKEIITSPEVPDNNNIGKRNVKIRTDIVEITDEEKGLRDCFEKSELFSEYYDLTMNDAMKLRLIIEELISFSRRLFPDYSYDFWISGNAERVKVHILVKNISVNNFVADELAALSSSDELEMNAVDKIKYSVYSCFKNLGKNSNQKWLWNSEDDADKENGLDRIILMNITDSISIGTKNNTVHIVAYKYLSAKNRIQ